MNPLTATPRDFLTLLPSSGETDAWSTFLERKTGDFYLVLIVSYGIAKHSATPISTRIFPHNTEQCSIFFLNSDAFVLLQSSFFYICNLFRTRI